MSLMQLRSSRSRSKTPFLSQELIDKEVTESGSHHVEKTVTRSSRRTTVHKTNENLASSSEEFSQSSYHTKPTKKTSRSLRSRILKTSDYSSEDGENEVSSTKSTISQNETNQLLEDARRSMENGRSDSPALELYKKSGRYWDVYPKTDWTYSQHSKDRVEIAPGVVAMPNMSRKAIHPLDESTIYSEHVAHKNVNTDTTYATRTTQNVKKNLFNNNDDYFIKRRSVTHWSSFKQTVITIFMSVISVMTYAFRYQTSWFAHVHNLAARVMLLDTWLLWKTKPGGDKTRKLVLLCLVPLLLLGGWWFLSSLGSLLFGTIANFTLPSAILGSGTKESINVVPSIIDKQAQETPNQNFDENNKRFDSAGHFTQNLDTVNRVIEEKIIKITEKVYMEPPSPGEIASNLSEEQLKIISEAIKNSLNLEINSNQNKGINIDEIVQKVIKSPNFHTSINNFNEYNVKTTSNTENSDNADILKKHQTLINSLIKEIRNMKQEMVLNQRIHRQDYSKLAFDIKKCCNKPQINIESYVTRIVTDLLNNPEYLNDQHGLNNWLKALFIAKTDLEQHLGNLTVNMDSKMADLVQENSKILMDNVAIKLTEIHSKFTNIDYQRTSEIQGSGGSVTDEQIRKIVQESLTIYDADKTGLVDYAMETMGGQILTTRCTETYHYGKAVVSVLGIPLWYPTNSPRTVITPGVNPGECWAFQNFPGFLVIKLSSRIKIEAFSMEHISKLLVPEGKIDSAPKEFEVYGLRSENDKEPTKLGTYIFDIEGNTIQYFMVDNPKQVFDMIELRMISNHGNPNYTCLYRFRVHGKLQHDDEYIVDLCIYLHFWSGIHLCLLKRNYIQKSYQPVNN